MATNRKRQPRSRFSGEDEIIFEWLQDPKNERWEDEEPILMEGEPHLCLIFPCICYDEWGKLLPKYWPMLTEKQQEYWKKRIFEEISPLYETARYIRMIEKAYDIKLLDDNYTGEFYYKQMRETAAQIMGNTTIEGGKKENGND